MTQHTQSQHTTHNTQHTHTQTHTHTHMCVYVNAHVHVHVNVSVSVYVNEVLQNSYMKQKKVEGHSLQTAEIYRSQHKTAHDSTLQRNPHLLLSSVFSPSLLLSSLIPSYPLFHSKKNKIISDQEIIMATPPNSGVFSQGPGYFGPEVEVETKKPVGNHFGPHGTRRSVVYHSKLHGRVVFVV